MPITFQFQKTPPILNGSDLFEQAARNNNFDTQLITKGNQHWQKLGRLMHDACFAPKTPLSVLSDQFENNDIPPTNTQNMTRKLKI